MKSLKYYDWFQMVIELFLGLLLVTSILACLNVFTSPFDGTYRIYIFVFLLTVYLLFVYLSKDKILWLLQKSLKGLEKMTLKEMILIIFGIILILKVVYSLLFFFDPTEGADIQLYAQLAKQIAETHTIPYHTISHLAGMGIHLACFEVMHIPYHIGLFILFTIATLVNMISFSRIIGKEKTFLLAVLYVLMPSTILLTFCPTHEVFVYFYFSIGLALLNNLLRENNTIHIFAKAVGIMLIAALMCFVSPMGYILCIIIILAVVLMKNRLLIKSALIIAVVLSILFSNGASSVIGADEYTTKMNTYSILIHGSNINSLGEQVDGYPEASVRSKVREMGLIFTTEDMQKAGLEVVKDQYLHLLTHPADLIKLMAHKFYIMWSGDYYPIEMAFNYGGISGLAYYGMLIISALIYLFVISVGVFFNKKKTSDYAVSNYKLAVLGTMAVTMITVVLNKYSIFITIFLYFVCFYRTGINDEQNN